MAIHDRTRGMKQLTRRLASRAGVDVRAWKLSVERRRARLLDLAGVQTVLDVGANEGQYAHTLRWAGFAGTIYSFEPGQGAFTTLRSAAANDERWEAVHTALGATNGTLQLVITQRSVFSSAKQPTLEMVEASPGVASDRIETVPLQRLDDWMEANDVDPTAAALKIDVQGAEEDVMAGATETLARVPLLEVELPLSPVYEGQWTFHEAVTQIAGLGFRPVLTENLMMAKDGATALQVNMFFRRLP